MGRHSATFFIGIFYKIGKTLYNESMNENEVINFEDRAYLSPQVGLDETNTFIDNLRNIQAQDTARINQDTYALGTQVPSSKGGLSGSEASFAERYQKPQTEQMIADLRTTAQTNALNQALENALAQYKERYNQAYRAAKKRERAKQNSGGGGGGGGTTPEGDVETPGYNLEGETWVPGAPGGYTIANIAAVDWDNGTVETDGWKYTPYGSNETYTITNKDLRNSNNSIPVNNLDSKTIKEKLLSGINNPKWK